MWGCYHPVIARENHLMLHLMIKAVAENTLNSFMGLIWVIATFFVALKVACR
jgi:hypothetical protein